MNILESAYKQALEEDAVMAAGDAGPVGDVSAPTAAVDNSIVATDNHMSHDDILGKYDPTKGVFGNGDFNLPKNVLGKGGMLKRLGYPSKKLKGHKNPYIKGMQIISEKDVDEVIVELSQKSSITEEGKDYSQKQIFDMLNQLKQDFKDPSDIDKFIEDHKVEIENVEPHKKEYGVISTAWKCLKYAAAKGWQFIKKFWWKILMLILVIAAILWFGQTSLGIKFGTKLFGSGYKNGVEITKSAVKTLISKAIPKVAKFESTLDALRKAKSWIPVDPALIPPGSRVDVGLDSAGNVFLVQLLDGTNGYSFSSDPETIYKPVFE